MSVPGLLADRRRSVVTAYSDTRATQESSLLRSRASGDASISSRSSGSSAQTSSRIVGSLGRIEQFGGGVEDLIFAGHVRYPWHTPTVLSVNLCAFQHRRVSHFPEEMSDGSRFKNVSRRSHPSADAARRVRNANGV